MACTIIKLSIFLISIVVCLLADDEVLENTTVLSCDDNITCSSLSTEANDDNFADNYSTETYLNDTFNDTIFVSTPQSVEPKINYDKQSEGNIDYCLCDLQLNYCDFNCCCDKNCTYEQKLLFSDCESSLQHQDSHYCYASEILYVNGFKTHRNLPESRLFCIVKSNLPSHRVVQSNKPIDSLEKIEYLTSKRHKWPKVMQNTDPEKFDPKNILPKYGYNIWLQLADAEIVPLMLPDMFISNICVQKKAVHFLENFMSTCAHKTIDEENSALNSETYYKNISILSLPKLSNFSISDYGLECPKNNCLSVNVFLCDESLTKCETLKNDTDTKLICHFSTFHNEQSCVFVTQKVRYHFFHNASNEITTINLYLYLTNITYFLGDSLEFVQHFEVNFFWAGYQQNFSTILSGNPGYMIKKYILLGDLVIDTSNNVSIKHLISKNDSDITDNFLVFPKNVEGVCLLKNDTYFAVQFGYNTQSNCVYQHEINIYENATILCINLQKQIFLLWQINITRTFEGSGKYVGMFGNSNRLKISEWVEIVYKFTDSKIFNNITGLFKNNKLICRNVAQVLSVNIIYAHVDFEFAKHQSKILNVFFELKFTDYLNFKYYYDESVKTNLINIDLIVEVMFHDVTMPKVIEFAEPPNLKLSLPHDFFYPFMMSGGQAISFNFIFIFFIFVPMICKIN